MSYSISVKSPSKTLAIDSVREKLAEVVVTQPVHAVDREQARAATEAFIALLPEDAAKDVVVSVSGSIWKTAEGVQQASLSVNVSLGTR